MSGRGPTPEELRAADIVVAFVGGRAISRPAVGDQKTHDFDIELADGRRLALEVTRLADPDVMKFEAEASRPRLAPQLREDWSAWIPGTETGVAAPRIWDVVNPIADALAIVERHGYPKVMLRDYEYYEFLPPQCPITGEAALDDAIRALAAQGVTCARSASEQAQPPTSRLSLFSHGSTVADGDHLNALVADRAREKREQLASAEAAEHHLLLWVSRTYPAANLAFTSQPPPDAAPTIPGEIDVVWLADMFPERVWRLRPPGGWEDLNLALSDGRSR